MSFFLAPLESSSFFFDEQSLNDRVITEYDLTDALGIVITKQNSFVITDEYGYGPRGIQIGSHISEVFRTIPMNDLRMDVNTREYMPALNEGYSYSIYEFDNALGYAIYTSIGRGDCLIWFDCLSRYGDWLTFKLILKESYVIEIHVGSASR